MLSPGELKRGRIIDIDGEPCVVESITVQTPSSRGSTTIWKVRGRNLKTKQKVDKAFRSGDTIGEPNFEKRAVQFLYRDTSGFHFMDLQDYDQFALSEKELESESAFLVESLEGLRALVLDEEVIGIELPLAVQLEISECDPAVRGNSATARTKKATLETGLVIQVPEHIAPGERVRIDTTTGKFVGRASK
ncbi:MAG: elongation factor P [Planctomycetota bacterium]|nr:elongation factor P [Planctomycetota bacterium]